MNSRGRWKDLKPIWSQVDWSSLGKRDGTKTNRPGDTSCGWSSISSTGLFQLIFNPLSSPLLFSLFIHCSLILRFVIPRNDIPTCLGPSSQPEPTVINDQQMVFLTWLFTSNPQPSFIYVCPKPVWLPSPVLFPSFPLNSMEMFCFRPGRALPLCLGKGNKTMKNLE